MAVISQKGGRDAAVDGGQEGVADMFVLEIQLCRQLISAPVKTDIEEPDIGHRVQQRLQSCIAALFDDLNGFRTGTAQNPASTVKAPAAVATGRSVSSSIATARTKATLREIW